MFRKKEHLIKLDDYFKINKPKYNYLKLTPNNSIRNYESDKIARIINNCFRNINERIYRKEKVWFYDTPSKVAYYIYITKMSCEFYFIVPEFYTRLFIEKFNDVWQGITVDIVSDIPRFSEDCTKYNLNYSKEDALSLKVDKRSNALLNSNLNVIEVLEEKSNDKIGIFYNFIPTSPYKQLGWLNQYNVTIQKFNKCEPVDRKKINTKYLLKMCLYFILNTIDGFIDTIQDLLINDERKRQDTSTLELALTRVFSSGRDLSSSTLNKGNSNIIDTEVIVLSESNSKINENNNAKAVAESFKSISEDNTLEASKIKNNIIFENFKFSSNYNRFSCEEIGNMISLPGRELLKTHNNIDKIDVLEREVPKELQKGYISLGVSTRKGLATEAFMSSDPNLANLGLVVLGSQGCGKTTALKKYSYDVISKSEGLVVFDFIKNCDLANNIRSITPKDKLIDLDLSNPNNLQSFAYNELNIDINSTPFEILELANLQTQQTVSLIDSINNTGDPLSARMRRFLTSACSIVYIQNSKSLKDVIKCLEDYKYREESIKNIPEKLTSYLEDEIRCLKELDEVNNKGENIGMVVGTKISKIEHILDRVNLLREDFKLKLMFNMSSENNINFIDEMNKGKVILIKMPEDKFNTKYIKNVLVTFFLTKIWLSCQIRGTMYEKPLRNHVIIDEVFQVPTCELILKNILVQARKYQLKFVFSAHYLSQINTISEALKASGSSYILFSGTDKKNFKELEDELSPYTVDDLLNLKERHSLNLIKTKNGYARFVTNHYNKRYI